MSTIEPLSTNAFGVGVWSGVEDLTGYEMPVFGDVLDGGSGVNPILGEFKVVNVSDAFERVATPKASRTTRGHRLHMSPDEFFYPLSVYENPVFSDHNLADTVLEGYRDFRNDQNQSYNFMPYNWGTSFTGAATIVIEVDRSLESQGGIVAESPVLEYSAIDIISRDVFGSRPEPPWEGGTLNPDCAGGGGGGSTRPDYGLLYPRKV